MCSSCFLNGGSDRASYGEGSVQRTCPEPEGIPIMPILPSVGTQLNSPPREPCRPEPVGVVLVSAEACHYCEAAREVIDRVAEDVALDVTVVASRSERGLALVRRHRASMVPLVLVDDRFVSNGRLSEKLFRKRVSQAVAAREAS